jgi:hypothetical protein
MQMRDTLRQVQGGSLRDELAAAFAVAPGQADAVMRAVMLELTWHLQKNTLSRGGLADLVEALGSGHHVAYLSAGNVFRDEAARADGNAILGHLLGSKDASRALAARAARQSGLVAFQVQAMLPHLAAVAMGGLALRAQTGLGEIVAQVPPLGRLSQGNAHSDLAGILRRRCGAGPYSPRALPRAVHQAIARAAGFRSRSVVAWYVRFMIGRTATRLLRTVVLRSGADAAPATGTATAQR